MSEPAARRQETPPDRPARRGLFSPLTLRILAINAMAPALLLASFLYLDYYREGLIAARLDALAVQGELIAGALGESAVSEPLEVPSLANNTARQLVRRLAAATDTRMRLFGEGGELIADSRFLIAAGRDVIVRPLPPPEKPPFGLAALNAMTRLVQQILPDDPRLPAYRERPDQRAEDYGEVMLALDGEVGRAVRVAADGRSILSVAVPVQGLRKIFGVLMLSVDSRAIEEAVQEERLNVLKLFLAIFAVTVLLSVFLGSTIVRPIRRLARAADQVRRGEVRRTVIPDFTARRDEIGDLSASLRAMTESLYRRLDAIEAFAADVAHELKNPLTSLRSAVETLGLTRDPAQQARLYDIIQQDVRRLDRLISDISNASRLDAELSRLESGPVDVARLLRAVAEVHAELARPGQPELVLDLPEGVPLVVRASEGRLGQVIRNLVDNAVSFSPPGGRIELGAMREGRIVRIRVADQGPGIPEDKLEAIFDRFYSERPKGEQFGTHSGLGLSISRQIVEAYRGHIAAANLKDAEGHIAGAEFTVELPAI
ncbi:MAG: stimulus-sensing domain-containing protein [Alphaproteobacteria bacterium]|nr:stimulus-sensing domain-containing protein [Alphaproteobacteria bacterium]